MSERRARLVSLLGDHQGLGGGQPLIATVLREAIVSGRLPPGLPLRQQEVAAVFGTSRIPVREGLRILQSEGLVSWEPYRGFAVSRLDEADVDDVYDLRILLETYAVRLVVPMLTDANVEHLQAAFDRWAAATSAAEHLQLRESFYVELYSLAGRPRLLAAIARLRQDVARVFGWAAIHHASETHERFFAAVKKGDEALAAAELSRHYETVRALLKRTIREGRPTG